MEIRKTIGIIGGGQLGKMLIESAENWDLKFHVLDPDPNCPCSTLADYFIIGSLTDEIKIDELAIGCDILTWEIEHVNANALQKLEDSGKLICPKPSILMMVQDKGIQKNFYKKNNIPTAPFFTANNKSQVIQNLDFILGDKLVIKSCTGGYDGKGVFITTKSEIKTNPEIIPFEGQMVVEEFAKNALEIAFIVCRDDKGNEAIFPSIEMQFHEGANLVDYLFSPANISAKDEKNGKSVALKLLEHLPGAGLFAVELFMLPDGLFWVNEMAPRPHNSGHHTIEGCKTSQFEQLVRILAGMPLGETTLIKPSAMINILGGEGFEGKYELDGKEQALQMKDVYIHMYNKQISKPNRKLGHVTILTELAKELDEKANYARQLLKIVPAKTA